MFNPLQLLSQFGSQQELAQQFGGEGQGPIFDKLSALRQFMAQGQQEQGQMPEGYPMPQMPMQGQGMPVRPQIQPQQPGAAYQDMQAGQGAYGPERMQRGPYGGGGYNMRRQRGIIGGPF